MEAFCTWLVVTLPRWIRELRFALQQDYLSAGWIREQRKAPQEDR